MSLKSILKELTPPIILKAFQGGNNTTYASADSLYSCSVCKNRVGSFQRIPPFYDDMLEQYEHVHSIFCYETLNRRQYSCPHCGASDRNRLYAVYLLDKFKQLQGTNKKYTLLDLAPDISLANQLLKRDFIEYRSADLYMEGVDDKVDITQMDIYEDERFDIVMCSHVLEHIPDDRKAMSELYRVMKKGGFGIVMAPILLTLNKDLENPEYNTEPLRWKYFGQDDHVRMYSKQGFVSKLSDAGFKVNQLGVDHFGIDIFTENGINPRSVLYVVEK